MAKKDKGATAVVEPETEELEELEEAAETDTKPSSKKGGEEVEFGVADLCKLVKDKTGKDYSTKDMRVLLRKMAREDTPRVQREVIAGNRSRYNFPGGAKNAEVKKVLAAVQKGEIEEGKKAQLDKLKEQKAAQKAAEGDTGKKGKKGKKGKGKDTDAVEEIEDLD
jgi:hypothetical protein